MPSAAEVLALETVAYELWRAPEAEELDGWRLRFAHGITGRANSVWPNAGGQLPLDEKLERVERWYEERDAPVLFQVTAAAVPEGLDAELAASGNACRGEPVSVCIADLETVVARTSGPAELAEEPDEAWLQLLAGSRGFGRIDVLLTMLTTGTCAFASVGEVAVGRGVAVGGWLGITNMATRPEARRRGHARAVVHALARWGRSRGCTRAILQVESGNVPARALYRSAGFAPHHEYRYRRRR